MSQTENVEGRKEIVEGRRKVVTRKQETDLERVIMQTPSMRTQQNLKSSAESHLSSLMHTIVVIVVVIIMIMRTALCSHAHNVALWRHSTGFEENMFA